MTAETYDSTTIYGVFSDKEILLEKYLYVLEHDSICYEYSAPLGACIYKVKCNMDYMESYYEVCEGGLEFFGTRILEVSPIEIWGEGVEKQLVHSKRIAQKK